MASWFSQLSSTVSSVAGLNTTVESVKTVAETAKDGQYYGKLDDHDLDWTLASGSSTENQIFYITTPSGGFAFVQLIHSNIGIWNPTISFTCRFYDPSKNINVFKNINMSKFELSTDRRSVKTDNMNITLLPDQQTFKVQITHPELVVSLDFTRVDRGFKVGEGKTYLGGDKGSAAGFVSHKFWPRAVAKGTFIIDKQLHEIDGDGMFIHAIQGMQPQLIASNWNFVNFQAKDAALSMMQFQTTKQYGAVNINQGSLVLNGKLICVSVDNHVELLDLQKDTDTDYDIPQRIKLTWKGKTIAEEGNTEDTKDVQVTMVVTVKNLIDKIDVLAEIPWFLKKLVQTFVVKPYIYQWLDTATAEIKVGDETVTVDGQCYQELVFVSGF
ncbi:oxidative stress survival, Svf1-like protein [Radiomyces spectabilis]|uniref:oxidative stress survival, Svf1-like protein n=1 Tax=Radiomyces spectabilis TaxID=64574 RepID=UPI00221FE414|nr:oxidative stress survival, Svf1-like protein [Radiomyces spectabilis]KAI8391059.1 oxidative stress survival, Svf1-like protein [Radiomyces spectabilis]